MVHSRGIEPRLQAPQAYVLSVERRVPQHDFYINTAQEINLCLK